MKLKRKFNIWLAQILIFSFVSMAFSIASAQTGASNNEASASALVQALQEKKSAEDQAKINKAREDDNGITAARQAGSDSVSAFGLIVIFACAAAALVFFSKIFVVYRHWKNMDKLLSFEENDSIEVKEWKTNRQKAMATDKKSNSTVVEKFNIFEILKMLDESYRWEQSRLEELLEKIKSNGI